jgi:DNA invertase Pin-like site-specific DNA recombinase
MFFDILATFAEFEVSLLRLRTREGMAVARAKGKPSQADSPPASQARPHARYRRIHHRRAHGSLSVGRATVYRALERACSVTATR